MKTLSYGSLNLDYVYSVSHFVQEGETLSSFNLETYAGGKGLNQSIAMSRAGLQVKHAGSVGENDGRFLLNTLEDSGVDTCKVRKLAISSGHAIIQRDTIGRNAILIFGGANLKVSREQIDFDLLDTEAGSMLVLQNEISEIPYLVDRGYERGLNIVLNPSPLNKKILDIDLSKVSIFLLNEIEAIQLLQLKGHKVEQKETFTEEEIKHTLCLISKEFPDATIVVTLGEYGASAISGETYVRQRAFEGEIVDTTAAGDCFTGYFLASLSCNKGLKESLRIASAASTIAISRNGASPSIPEKEEVEEFLLLDPKEK